MSAGKLQNIRQRRMIDPKLGKLTFTNGVEELVEGTFGEQVVFKNFPEKTTGIILCTSHHGGPGLRPIRTLLIHQVYTKDLKEMMDEDSSIDSFTAIPINSKAYNKFLMK